MIDRTEWETAKRLFAELPAHERKPGKKIKRGTVGNLSHSFLLTEGGILLGLANKAEGILGRGGRGRVKLAEDENGNLIALKRLGKPLGSQFSFELYEMEMAFDVGVAIEPKPTYREVRDTTKIYLPLLYLGKPLSLLLEKDNWTDDEACRVAIQLALVIDDLHTGKLSKTGQKHEHNDLKPANITIDHEGNPHLIDFGQDGARTAGYSDRFYGVSRDLWSYLRIVFQKDDWGKIAILSNYLVHQHPDLLTLIDTTEGGDLPPQASFLEIAKTLTRIRCNLDPSYQLNDAEAIRDANTQYEATLTRINGDSGLEATLTSAMEQFKTDFRAFVRIFDEGHTIRGKKQIAEVEQEKIKWLKQLDTIGRPIVSILNSQDNQTRKSKCLNKYYALRSKIEDIAAQEIYSINAYRRSAAKAQDCIQAINLGEIQAFTTYTELREYTLENWANFKTLERRTIYVDNVSALEEKRNIWVSAVLNKALAMSDVSEETMRIYGKLDYSDKHIQQALVYLICAIQNSAGASLFYDCSEIMQSERPEEMLSLIKQMQEQIKKLQQLNTTTQPVLEAAKVVAEPAPVNSSEPLNKPLPPKESNSSYNLALRILSGFSTALGIAAVTLAFAVLNVVTGGIPGIVLCTIGVGLVAAGTFGFFQSRTGSKLNSNPLSSSEVISCPA